MRLIDVDNLKRRIVAFCTGCSTTYLTIDNMMMLINQAGIVDAVPVVHGWWLTWEEQFPGRTLRAKSVLGVFCSACHNHADNMFNYCPNCGAKMDLEEEHG